MAQCSQNTLVYNIRVSPVTHLNCSGNFNNCFNCK